MTSDKATRDVLARHMPGAAVIFVTDPEGNRSVVAFEGPRPSASPITGAGFRVKAAAELREAS